MQEVNVTFKIEEGQKTFIEIIHELHKVQVSSKIGLTLKGVHVDHFEDDIDLDDLDEEDE